jgi:hypothetical protein
MHVTTAGSVGGVLRTGSYVDHRQRTHTGHNGSPTPGLLHNQYLGNVLQAMGPLAGDRQRAVVPGRRADRAVALAQCFLGTTSGRPLQ